MDRNNHVPEEVLNSHYYTAWELIKLYWQSSEKRYAYGYLFVIIAMTMVLVAFSVAFNYWFSYFYNALQAYDRKTTLWLLLIFFALAAGAIVLAVYRYYLSSLLGLRWRRWLTDQFINRWLEKRGYYYLENFDEKTDNPDQRIQEDIEAIVNNSISLFIGLISATATFLAFIYVLWQLSGDLVLPLGPFGTFHIPGYLVWVGIIYAIVGTLLTFKIGRPLVSLNFEQQRREANFRFAAVDLRRHSEDVALYRGERQQGNLLKGLFKSVLENWYAIILRQKTLLWFTSGYNQLAVVLPLLVALPNYFDKVFLLGGLIQTIRAFDSVQESLSFLINSFTDIAQWRAVTQRLTTFLNHLFESENKAETENKLTVEHQPQANIIAKQVSIKTPRGRELLQNIDETFIKGQHYLIKGESGIGKSTFIRTIAGIWPFASGSVVLPQDQKIMYLPQQPYMPLGTLREALLFPNKTNPEIEAKLPDILRQCRLESFIPRLGETASWAEQMSPGEQQRVGLARILLQKPDWVFLDESTSMLDMANEAYFYKLIRESLPGTTAVSIGHRPSLDSYHDHTIDMSKYSQLAVEI